MALTVVLFTAVEFELLLESDLDELELELLFWFVFVLVFVLVRVPGRRCADRNHFTLVQLARYAFARDAQKQLAVTAAERARSAGHNWNSLRQRVAAIPCLRG